MGLYTEWRKVAYGQPGSRNRNAFNSNKVTIFVIREEDDRMWYQQHSTIKTLMYDVYTLTVQSWHFKKARAKNASKVMATLHLGYMMKNGYHHRIFDKIKNTGSF